MIAEVYKDFSISIFGNMNNIKINLLSIFCAVIAFLYNSITGIVFVLLFFVIIDYVTGIAKLFFTKQIFSWKTGVIGVVRKLMYGLLVMVGFLTDYIIIATSNDLGIDLKIKGFIGITIVFYLISNEGLSILNNLKDCGVPLPTFLANIFDKLKNDSNQGKI